MKLKLLTVALICCFSLFAKGQLISQNATYTYTSYEGLIGNNFVHSNWELGNGSLLIKSYQGPMQIIKNNQIITLPHTSPENNFTPHITGLVNIDLNTSWAFGDNQIIILQNDSIKKVIKVEEHIITSSNRLTGGVCLFTVEGVTQKHGSLCSFDGMHIRKLYSFNHYVSILDFSNIEAYIKVEEDDRNKVFRLNERFKIVDSLVIPYARVGILEFKDYKNYCFNVNGKFDKLYEVKNGNMSVTHYPYFYNKQIHNTSYNYLWRLYNEENGNKIVFGNNSKPIGNTYLGANSTYVVLNFDNNSFYLGTGTQLLRVFPSINTYPKLFNQNNSNNIFTICQDKLHRIWVGSYDNYLSIIDNNSLSSHYDENLRFMSGSLSYNDKLFMIAESEQFGGILRFDDIGKYTQITKHVTGYYLYQKNNKLYFGTSQKGLWISDINECLHNDSPKWEIIGQDEGMLLGNIISIVGDNFGNIFLTHPRKGIAVYETLANKCKTWLVEKNQIDFGAMSTVLDHQNTIWFGTANKGLVGYKTNNNPFNHKEAFVIEHPLISKTKIISFMKQWGNYLIMGQEDRILVFDLLQWYKKKKIIVRYLSSQETNFTANTEQNSILIDDKDSSIWFSTSNLLYHWDIAQWLKLPSHHVSPQVTLNGSEINPLKEMKLAYDKNSFDIQVNFQSLDNLPRMLSVALIEKGDTMVIPEPSTQTSFSFKNLRSGHYTIYVQFCQSDGSVSNYHFPIFIDTIFYKKWWFILATIFLVFSLMGYLVWNGYKRNQQEKQISHLKMLTISNQFRPHLILNSLNVVQAEAFNKPNSIQIIDKLGESIGILFNQQQKQSVTHSLQQEWKLLVNSIEMFKVIYLPELITEITDEEIISKYNIKIPICLLQIPVENALVHGLANKSLPPHLIKVNFMEDEENYMVKIIDNGIGLSESKKINMLEKHGTGLKNIQSLLNILNQYNQKKLTIVINDLVKEGTEVMITIPKIFNYEY